MTKPHASKPPSKHKSAAKSKPAALGCPSAGEKLVTLDNAGVKSGAHWRVRHISFSVARGEIITLIGPNGSGKSTTAKLAADILAASEGGVTRLPGLKIGYVPQKLHLDSSLPLSVERLMCLTAPLPQAAITAALEQVGMAGKRKEPVAALSGGQLQRALLARAAARRTDLLILDEPLQGVDFSWESTLYTQISRYKQSLNCGILLISHDLHNVMAASDRVLCLNGHICCSGKPEEIAQTPEYISLFTHGGGLPAAAAPLMPYRHKHDHKHN